MIVISHIDKAKMAFEKLGFQSYDFHEIDETFFVFIFQIFFA
jgi:hypothetical protein